eukprot:scaffold200_cov401-Prasinococcus_capsulatus_cf.AAC.6
MNTGVRRAFPLATMLRPIGKQRDRCGLPGVDRALKIRPNFRTHIYPGPRSMRALEGLLEMMPGYDTYCTRREAVSRLQARLRSGPGAATRATIGSVEAADVLPEEDPGLGVAPVDNRVSRWLRVPCCYG